MSTHNIWAASWQNQQNGMCAQRRLRSALITHWAHSDDWSDWADAQADLSLRWAHMSVCWFCHEAAQIFFYQAPTIPVSLLNHDHAAAAGSLMKIHWQGLQLPLRRRHTMVLWLAFSFLDLIFTHFVVIIIFFSPNVSPICHKLRSKSFENKLTTCNFRFIDKGG